MKQIKILLADYPSALPESVKTAFRQLRERQDQLADDMCTYIVEELEGVDNRSSLDMLLWAKNNKADELTIAVAVVLGLGSSEQTGLLDHLLTTDRNLTILGVDPKSKSAFIEQLCPRRREVLDLSGAGMIAALRRAIRQPCGAE